MKSVEDLIMEALQMKGGHATLAEIYKHVAEARPAGNNQGKRYDHTVRGIIYRLKKKGTIQNNLDGSYSLMGM